MRCRCPLLRRRATTTATLLVASRAPGLFSHLIAACHPDLSSRIFSLTRDTLCCRHRAAMTHLALSYQVVRFPSGTGIARPTAQAHELRRFLVWWWRCLQVEREDGQAVAVQRQLHVALEIIEVGHLLLGHAVELVQQPRVFSGYMKSKEVVDIG